MFSAASQAERTDRSAVSASLPPATRQAVRARNLHDYSGLAATDALPEPLEVSETDVIPLTADTAMAPDLPLVSAPRIAIVIDDVGLDVAAAQRALDLDTPLSLAILPYAEAAPSLSAQTVARGRDVLLHMPMEPVGLADPGPNALRLGLSDEDLAARMRWAYARVPGAVGINNHMGSRFTADPRAMRVALASVAEQNPLFLDSLTTGESRGRAVADGLGLRALQRDIFLDHVIDASQIEARLAEAEELARERGWAVVIGHPHAETLDVLENWLSPARERGVEFVTLTQLSAQLDTRLRPTAENTSQR
ncbi:divergent polysaccharide deacetylase family protein [Maricaulis parjimensis]|uniref:divergent polysaccharide deacetylase family protein n=1 Tax=Maricaulis parjimensis TaxID=144023 RepID=UPI00193A0844